MLSPFRRVLRHGWSSGGGILLDDHLLHSYFGFNGHTWPQEMLRVLSLLEYDFHWDALHHLYVIASGILGWQQAEARTRRAANVENVSVIGPAVRVHRNLYGLTRLHIGQLGLFKISRNPDVLAIEGNNRHELLTGGNVLTRLHTSLTYDSTYRCYDGGVLQIELSLLQCGLRLLCLSVGSLSPRLLQRDLLWTSLRVMQFGLGLRDASTRPSHGLLGGRRRCAGGFNRRSRGLLSVYRLSVLLLRDFVFFGQRFVTCHIVLRLEIVCFCLPQRGLRRFKLPLRRRQSRLNIFHVGLGRRKLAGSVHRGQRHVDASRLGGGSDVGPSCLRVH